MEFPHISRMPIALKPLLLASIHDVSPRFESEVDRLMDLLRPYVGCAIAMLVVPNHWGDAPIVPGSPFASAFAIGRMRASKSSCTAIFIATTSRHQAEADQFAPRFMTAGEGEFLGLARKEAASRIAEGRALLEGVIGRPIDGFVAPAWLYGEGARAALADCAIPLAEDHFQVWSPATGAQLARGPVITWASRTRARLASSLLAAARASNAPMKVLRIGVHPPDCRHPALVRSIEKTLRSGKARRPPRRYSDLLPDRLTAA